MKEFFDLLSLICNFVFNSCDKRAISIAGDIYECVRVDSDFIIVRFEERQHK